MEQKCYLRRFTDSIIANSRGRKIVIWGVCSRAKTLESLLGGGGGTPLFYVDSDPLKINGSSIRQVSALVHKSHEFFVVIPLAYHTEIVEFLHNNGYTENDYCYLSHPPSEVTDCTDYSDDYGNRISGNVGGSRFIFCGYDSHVEIGSDFFAEENVRIQVYSDCTFEIGKKSFVGSYSSIILGDNSICLIGSHSHLGHRTSLVACENSRINLSDFFTAGTYCGFIAESETEVAFGYDCLLSNNVVARSNDGHTIFDVHTGKNVNSTLEISKARKIVIKDHVWIGQGVTILYNSFIEHGSIIGANSLVKGVFPNNCILAGNPAKIIKSDVAWSRMRMSEDIMSCGIENIGVTNPI